MSDVLELPEASSPLSVDDGNTDPFRKRVQLDFSREAYERLQELKKESKAGTLTRVIRQSLLLFDWFVTYKRQGYVLQMRGPNGDLIEMPDLFRTF